MATSARTQSDSAISNGQIGQITDRLSTKLRDSGLSAEGVQAILAAPGGAAIDDMVATLRKHVEANSDLIVRRVSVNRHRSARGAIEATGRKPYVTNDVVDAMPRGVGIETELVFFKVGRWLTVQELDAEYTLRNLDAADPFSLAAVNEADPAFAEERPNATQWKDAQGKHCYATFRRWDDKRSVHVYRYGSDWYDDWWFAGLRKSA